jgi:hypothetical protein
MEGGTDSDDYSVPDECGSDELEEIGTDDDAGEAEITYDGMDDREAHRTAKKPFIESDGFDEVREWLGLCEAAW